MTFGAGAVKRNFPEAWRRPVRPNLRIERAAMWSALVVARECRVALEADDAQALLPVGLDVGRQYQYQAAVRSLANLLPFAKHECIDIAGPNDQLLNHDYEFESGAIADRRPDAVERWHEWLWTGSYDRDARTVTSGPSAVYLAGCDHLAQSVSAILNAQAG
jgi:hypothetical protein